MHWHKKNERAKGQKKGIIIACIAGLEGGGRGGEEGVKLTKTMQFYHLLIFIIHLFFIMIDYRVSFVFLSTFAMLA